MRALGFVFLALIGSFGLITADYHLGSTFLNNFLDDHFVETFAALAGFNIAAVVFLIGQLLSLEERFETQFDGVRVEIKHNSYFLLGGFVFSLVLLIIRPDYQQGVGFIQNIWFYGVNVAVMATFALAIFAIFEILQAVFLLGKTPENHIK